MSINTDPSGRKKLKRRRPVSESDDDAGADSSSSAALWIILAMAIIGIACLLIGLVRHGFEWSAFLGAIGCLVTGIGFVAIGLLELEWLERIIGFVDGIFSGLAQYFWTTQAGSVSDFFGRRQATVIWVMFGVPIFIWGCLVGLHII